MSNSISDADMEALCHRAKADPQSITRSEHNIIWGWPPPEDEDRICIAKTGSTRAQLCAKALATPDDLTYDEAVMVYNPLRLLFDDDDKERNQSPRPDTSLAKWNNNRALQLAQPRTPLQTLRGEAELSLRTAAGADARTARRNAVRRRIALDAAADAEAQRRRDEWAAAKRLEDGTGWITLLLENNLLENGNGCWGFVVFRTGAYHGGGEAEVAWRRFREYFDQMAKAVVLHWNSGPLLWPSFRAIFVEGDELDGASEEELRRRFRAMRDGDGGGGVVNGDSPSLPKGIRTSCFLVADERAIRSDAARLGFQFDYVFGLAPAIHIPEEAPVVYIRALDPDYDKAVREEEDDDKMDGFQGEVTVALPRVFDWLHLQCFHWENGTVYRQARFRGWGNIYPQARVPEAWVRNYAPNSGVNYSHVPLRG